MRWTLVLALAAALVAMSSLPLSGVSADDKKRDIAAIENDLVADAPAVRAKAAAELADRFPEGAVAVPMLVDLLEDESPEVVAAAAKSIESLAIAGAIVLTAYYTDEEHWKPGTWLAALDANSTTRPRSSGFDTRGTRLEKDGPAPDEIAMSALAQAPEETPWLLDLSRGPSPEMRVLAAAALSMHGVDAVSAHGIRPSPHPGRSAAAASATPLIKSTSRLRSWTGARIAGRLRPSDEAVVAALTDSLISRAGSRTGEADAAAEFTATGPCWALGEIGTSAAAAGPVLLGLAETQSELVGPCVSALVRLGREADVVALLGEAPPSALEIAFALASERRAVATVVPYFVAKFSDSKGVERRFAIEAFICLGPAASAALPALKKCAGEPKDPLVTWLCADAILAVSPSDADGLKLVERDLASSDIYVHRRAVETLARRAAPTPLVVVRLLEFLGQEECPGSVVDAIARCGPAAKGCVDDLVRLTATADKRCSEFWNKPRAVSERRGCVVALGRIGPGAAAAISALTALRDNGDETIRVAAAQAIRRIRTKK